MDDVHTDPSPQENQWDEEDLLRKVMEQARVALELAKAKFESETNEARDIGLDQIDGAHLLLRVTGGYRSALLAYRDAVRNYADWLVRARK